MEQKFIIERHYPEWRESALLAAPILSQEALAHAFFRQSVPRAIAAQINRSAIDQASLATARGTDSQ
jgi:hypothetical protein